MFYLLHLRRAGLNTLTKYSNTLQFLLVMVITNANYNYMPCTKGVQKVRGKVPAYHYFVNQLN